RTCAAHNGARRGARRRGRGVVGSSGGAGKPWGDGRWAFEMSTGLILFPFSPFTPFNACELIGLGQAFPFARLGKGFWSTMYERVLTQNLPSRCNAIMNLSPIRHPCYSHAL